MRRALLVAMVLLALPSFLSDGAAHDRTPGNHVTNYYVHRFDPQVHQAPMDRTQPGPDETPDPDTDLNATGDPQVTYTFESTVALTKDETLSAELNGTFRIWIKPYQNNTLGAPNTKVTFRLETTSGILIGTGQDMRDLKGGNESQAFTATYRPIVRTLPAGSVLRWIVNITDGSVPTGSYNPIAAPYGVSRQNPFIVSLVTQHIPPPVPMIRIVVERDTLSNLTVTDQAVFPFKIFNDADEPDNVTLILEQFPTGPLGFIDDASGQHVGRVLVPPLSSVDLVVRVTNLSPGRNEAFLLRVTSDLGAAETVGFHYSVLGTITTPEEGRSPGFVAVPAALAAGAAVFLRRRRE